MTFLTSFLTNYRYQTAPKDLGAKLSCNSLFTVTTGGVFILDAILSFDKRGFFLGRKIALTNYFNCDLDKHVMKVLTVQKKKKIIRVEFVMNYTYHIMLSPGDDSIAFISKLPNTLERE